MTNTHQPPRRNFISPLLSAALLSMLLFLLWPSTTNVHAQQQPIQVCSSLVQVDELVTDANGTRIENLNLNNFQLSEDRHPQKLTAVDFYDIRKFPSSRETKLINLSLTDSTDSEIREAV